jgi:hypothetical protein
MFLVGVPASNLVLLPQAVQAHAVGPLPVVPALGVDHPAIVQAKQELAGLVLDVDQVADQQGDLGLDVLGLEAVCEIGHGVVSLEV